MKKSHIVITILLFILAALCFILFESIKLTIIADNLTADRLLRGTISRAALALLFGWALYISGGKKLMTFNKQFFRLFVWSLPCFMVAFVNFPYSALISGEASIVEGNLMWLYVVYTLSVALLEEFIFRGVLFVLAKDYFKNKRHAPLIITLICAAIFALFHLTNLFNPGVSVGLVFLQCIYTFLIGAMLTITMLKLNNVWLCVLVHAIFNFGGQIIENIGIGNPWDKIFWILTIAGGVLCAGHFIYTLIKLDKNYVSE